MNDMVRITVDGRELQARKGSMLIEVTDQQHIYIPRFCYHKKLSIAANCRMCMVEVEKAPKPLPACATPVSDGMVVHTRSRLARDAQKSTMEFLLINHPLDCPVCDQGGECELQDLAVGYGRNISRYTEKKRVVADQNIGPLVSTDMTRCIHCTRCVRFGEEIAGLRELGATGRGEFMKIGTYIEKSLVSELSGNVIDLCPVGALNAKPSRMHARSWEMIQHVGISPHDSTGSNVYVHVLRNQIIRVVPKDHEQINETWISDRDRFSYEALYSEDRLTDCMQKQDEHWNPIDWSLAIQSVAEILKKADPDDVGVLVSPNQTNEELYLLQKICRALGIYNIDHRIHRCDFSGQDHDPLFPWLGQSISDLEQLDSVFLIGSDIRCEQPMIAHRLRKMIRGGGKLNALNAKQFDWYMPVNQHLNVSPRLWCYKLLSIIAALPVQNQQRCPDWLRSRLSEIEVCDASRKTAESLSSVSHSLVMLGELAAQHPDYFALCVLAYWLAECTDSRFGFVQQSANRAGAALAGALPHRSVAGQQVVTQGAHYRKLIEQPRKVYICVGFEPEHDCAYPVETITALKQAEHVVMFTAFESEAMRNYANFLLPTALFAENEGSYVNAEGRWQSFHQAVKDREDIRPLWKVLRILANELALEGFNYFSCEQIREELQNAFDGNQTFDNRFDTARIDISGIIDREILLWRVSAAPIYSIDPMARRAASLQKAQAVDATFVCLHSSTARQLQVNDGDWLRIEQNHIHINLLCKITNVVAPDVVWIDSHAFGSQQQVLGNNGVVSVSKVTSS